MLDALSMQKKVVHQGLSVNCIVIMKAFLHLLVKSGSEKVPGKVGIGWKKLALYLTGLPPRSMRLNCISYVLSFISNIEQIIISSHRKYYFQDAAQKACSFLFK
jgi:hypothetical protein